MNIGELIATIGADTTKFDQALTRTEDRLKSAGKSMQKAGRQMSMAVTAPLVAVGALGLRTAANFESAMNKVKAVSGATGDEFKQLEGIARELGASTKFSATEAAEGMGFLAMAGFDVKEIMQAMPATLNLAAAGNMQLAESADIVSNIMQGFGLEASQTGETVDILTKTFTSSNTSLTQLGEAMSYVAPAARAFGQDITMTSAAVGILSDAGIQASKAGTGLRQAFIQLQKKSDDLGISVTDTNGKMLPLVDILQNIEDAGLTTAEVINTVGPRAGTALAALIDRGPQALSDFTTELNNAGGTAKQVADTQMEGLNGALTELRSATSELAIAFSEDFKGSVEDLVDSVTGAVRWLSNLDKGVKRVIVIFGGLLAAIGPVLLVGGMLVEQTGNLIKGFSFANKAIRKAIVRYGGLKLAMAGVGVALAALIAGYINHRSEVANFNDSQKEIASAITTAKKSIVDEKMAVQDLITAIKDENTTRKEKVEALEQLRKISPEYFGDLKIEDGLLKDLKKSQEAYNEELIRGAKIEAFKDKLVELNKELIELKNEGSDVSFWNRLEGAVTGFGSATSGALNGANAATREYATQIGNTEEAINNITKRIRELGSTTGMSVSAFDEQNKRLGNTDKITLDLSGNLQDLNDRLVNVKGEMISLAAAKEPIPQRLVDMAKAYRDRISELTTEQAENAGIAAMMEKAQKGVLTTLQSFQSVLTQPIIDSEKTKQAEELMRGLSSVFMGTYQEIESAKPDASGLSLFPSPTPEQIAGVDELANRWQNTAQQINGAVEYAAEGVLIGVGKMAGSLIAGTGSFKDFGNFILKTLGQLAVDIGTMMVEFGVAFSIIKKFAMSNPFLAIAGGVALIAAGTALTSSISKKMENAGGGGGGSPDFGMQGLATGGEVVRSGNFLVGEQGPEMVNLPRGAAVTPNHMLGQKSENRTLTAVVNGQQLEFVLNEWSEQKNKIT